MSKQIRLGMLTPSSNTALEPITSAMVADLPNVSAHFSRFTVTEISLRDQALGQFDLEKILGAARLLADARVDVIAWNGTSSGWLGFDRDQALCKQITEATGIPATTSVLALNEILEKTGARRFGLATPYLDDVQQRIIANYQRSGFDCTAERHLDLHVNYSFAEVEEDTIRGMVRELARENVQAAHLAEELEAETGIPLYDTISTVVWKSLRMAGVDTSALKGWGRLFREVA
jgi:maleate isomerase